MDPLELPRSWPGVDLLCALVERARKRRKKRKLIERTKKGKRSSWYERKKWIFPYVQKEWARHIVKKILGPEYYPHFLRLNRLTEIGTNPKANLVMIKSFSGIKTTRIIERHYLGISKREQKAALDFMEKQINPE